MNKALGLLLPILLVLIGSVRAADETAERAAEVERERKVRREADRTAGVHLLEEGRRLAEEGRLEEAEASLRRAVALMPSDRGAREELEGVRSALGVTADRRHEILSELARARAVREDLARVEVDGRVRQARRLLDEGRSAEAIRILKEAEDRIRWMASGPPRADRDRELVRRMLEEAREAAQEESERRRRAQIDEASRQAALEWEAVRDQEARRLAALGDAGLEALRSGRYDEAERTAVQWEALRPGDAGAAHLKLLARERRHLAVRDDLRGSATEEWRNLSEFAEEQQIPYSRSGEVLRHPPGWERERKRRSQTVSEVEGEQAPAWEASLRERLRQGVHYKFDGVSFRDAKEYLEAQGRVVINVDKAALDASPSLNETSIHLSSPEGGMSLENALNFLTRHVNLAWTLRDESIMITTQEGSRGEDVLAQYDVRDLVSKLKDYPGPKVQLGQGGEGFKIDTEEERENEEMSKDDLVDFIRKLVEASAGDTKR